MALNRLVAGVAVRRSASSPRHRIAMRARRVVGSNVLGSDMVNGSALSCSGPRERGPRAGLGRGPSGTPGACDFPTLDPSLDPPCDQDSASGVPVRTEPYNRRCPIAALWGV